MGENLTQILHANRRYWGKNEVPHCELRSVTYPSKLGEPIAFCLTLRGQKVLKQKNMADARIQKQNKLWMRSKACKIQEAQMFRWWLFGHC